MTLQDKLRAKRFVITAEVTPPVSADRDELLAKALPLKGLADAVNITDGAGARPHLGAVTAAALLVEAGIEPILQLTCRDRNRIALQSDLLSAAASGVRNLLMLRGDDPSAGDQPDAKPVFDLDPRQLLETARRLRDTGELPSGRKVSGRADFFLGGADNPIDPPPGWAAEGAARQDRRRRAIRADAVLHGCRRGAPLHGAARRTRPRRQALAASSASCRCARPSRRAGSRTSCSAPSSPTRSSSAWSAPPIRRRKAAASASISSPSSPTSRTSPACHIMAPGNDAAVPEIIGAAQTISRLAPA